jgi:hypothetical protein
MRPKFFLCRRPEHDRRGLEKRLVIFRKLESGVLEGLAEIVQLGKIHMARAAGGAVKA